MARYNLITSPTESNPAAGTAVPIICDVELAHPAPGDQRRVVLSVTSNGVSRQVTVLDWGPPLLLSIDDRPFEVIEDVGSEFRVLGSETSLQLVSGAHRTSSANLASTELRAPMPGRIVKVLCEVGQVVERGAPLLVLEAMKMENELVAPTTARIGGILVAEGSAVEARATLLTFAEP